MVVSLLRQKFTTRLHLTVGVLLILGLMVLTSTVSSLREPLNAMMTYSQGSPVNEQKVYTSPEVSQPEVSQPKSQQPEITQLKVQPPEVTPRPPGASVRLTNEDTLERVKEAKAKLMAKLKVDYGEYVDAIFVDNAPDGTPKGFLPVTPDGKSEERLRRKLMIKVLSAQSAMGRRNLRQHNDPSSSRVLSDQSPDISSFAKLVWSVGGDSTTAAHGNLYNETYSAWLERDVKEVFQSIGIDFEVRNHGIGGTSSGPEISMCWEQIFGGDSDIFVWDYALTDLREVILTLHSAYRSALAADNPIFIGFDNSNRQEKRIQLLLEFEKIGMSAFLSSEPGRLAAVEAIPDSIELLDDIEKLPEYLRFFKCGDKLESGTPCKSMKFTENICHPRPMQTSWHPGFKFNAMRGHMVSLWVIDKLIDAVNTLVELKEDTESLLTRLKQEEAEDVNTFRNAPLPDFTQQVGFPRQEDGSSHSHEMMWNSPIMCRTARLPAMSRYLGYTTNTDKLGGMAPLGQETYDIGIDNAVAKSMEGTGEMMLAFELDDKTHEKCPVVLTPDHADYFYAHQRHGWSKLTVPNEAERAAYGFDPSKVNGLVVVWFKLCHFHKCKPGDLRYNDFKEGSFEIMVNDKPVKEMVEFGGGYALKGETGMLFEPKADVGYELSVRVIKEESYLKISTMVVI